jgi:hypothetical protein
MKHLFSLVVFLVFSGWVSGQDILLLKTSGKVVIGDTSIISTPGPYNLYVQNGVLTEKVKVALKSANDWSDDAFNHTPSLETVKTSIEKNSHLHNMPSAEELVRDGFELQKMDAKIVEQIEWLWQHMIKLSEENQLLREELNALKTNTSDKN